MSPNELTLLIKQDFPILIFPTQQEARRIWGGKENELIEPYRFLEALANILNEEMNRNTLNINFERFFEVIRHAYMIGDDETKNYIDVALVENLFWKVKKEQAKFYWEKFPPILQQLYEDFHWKKAYE